MGGAGPETGLRVVFLVATLEEQWQLRYKDWLTTKRAPQESEEQKSAGWAEISLGILKVPKTRPKGAERGSRRDRAHGRITNKSIDGKS